MNSEILTPKQAAALLHVSAPTLRKAVREHGLPCVKIGRVVRFRRSAVEQWFQAREAASNGSNGA